MKRFLFIAALAVCVSLPASAQQAPGGWKTQTKAGGAKVFTPPDLRVGEIYSVTVYEPVPLGGKSLETWLRAFAGTVGSQSGQLRAPLEIGASQVQNTSATGIYRGPKGTQLSAAFNAFSLDGGRKVWVMRVLTSADAVFFRYQNSYQALALALSRRAANEEVTLEKRPEVATARRYRFTTAPGRGIATSQIALVLHYGAMAMFVGGTTMVNEEFLLLKDGTIHRGLPVPPDEMNLAASKRGEPQNWGKWRRKGQAFEVSWQGKAWEVLEGTQVKPGAAGTRISGRYGGASGTSGLGSGSYAYYGVAFQPNGRFQTDRSGGGYSQNLGPGGGAASYGYGSEGSVVTAGGVVTVKGKPNPKADREGTYTLNGYTLTLRYDNGRVVRQPFFFLGNKREGVLFGDEVLLRDEK